MRIYNKIFISGFIFLISFVNLSFCELLKNKYIIMSPGHGWVWSATTNNWLTERGAAQYGLIEDLNNWNIARHVKAYLEDAGATTKTVRDMGPKCFDKYTGKGPNPTLVTIAAKYPWWQVTSRYYFYENRYGENVPVTVYDSQYTDGSESNKSLRSRTYYANWLKKEYSKCDLYLSMHSNAAGATARGTVVLCDNDSDATDAKDYDGGDFTEHTQNITNSYNYAKKLATQVIAIMKKYYDSGWTYTYSATGVWQANWKWWETRGVQKPSALIEYGFHTNSEDAKALVDEKGRRLMAQATYKGICDYLNISYELPSAITDLRTISGADIGQIRLIWSAPGEDGTFQPAKNYVVKYSSLYVIDTQTKYNTAAIYSQTWTPKRRYFREDYIISRLTPGVTYYFVVISQNDTADTSKLSNCSSALAQTATSTMSYTGSVVGQVVDLVSRQGIAGAGILLSPDDISLKTNSAGQFQSSNLLPGDFVATVTTTGYVSESKEFLVSSGATATITFELILSNYATLTGRITNSSTDVPIYNAKCSLSSGGFEDYTDSDGKFAIARIPSGAYSITITAAGYQTKSQVSTLTAGQKTDFNISLIPGDGAVSKGVITGTIKDIKNGLLIQDAVCHLNPEGLQKISDATGKYRFDNIDSGSHTITISFSGYDTIFSTCNLSSGATVYLNFGLVLLSTGPTPGQVFGRVISESNESPIENVELNLTPGTLKTVSDSLGNYVFNNLSAGEYTLTATKSGYVTRAETVVLTDGGFSELLIVLLPVQSSEIKGKVTDKYTGVGIGNVICKIVKGESTKTIITDSAGNYKFENITDIGFWDLQVSHIAYESYETKIYTEIGSIHTENVALNLLDNLTNVKISNSVFAPVKPDGTKSKLELQFNVTSQDSAVTIKIYDLNGRVVKILENVKITGSRVDALWDGTNTEGRAVKSGIYFYQIQSDGKIRNGKIVLAK